MCVSLLDQQSPIQLLDRANTSIYIYICIYTFMYIQTYSYICACIHVYMCVYIYVHMYIYIYMYIYMYAHTYEHGCMYVHAQSATFCRRKIFADLPEEATIIVERIQVLGIFLELCHKHAYVCMCVFLLFQMVANMYL